jgi:hypothetical protein
LCLVLACAFAVAAGCRRTTPPPVILDDAGPLPDTTIPADLDSDGDGICDFNEIQRRTDPDDPDSDDDGFSDYVEAQNGTGPNDLTSPDRSIVVTMSEAFDGALELPLAFSVRGIGETFSGELVRVPIFLADDGTEARTFFAGSHALAATPMENVRGGFEGTSFFGVIGRTLLTFDLRFEQRQGARGCMRAYPFAYTVKTGEGSARGTTQRWLVIVPPGMSIGAPDARWCGPVTTTCL